MSMEGRSIFFQSWEARLYICLKLWNNYSVFLDSNMQALAWGLCCLTHLALESKFMRETIFSNVDPLSVRAEKKFCYSEIRHETPFKNATAFVCFFSESADWKRWNVWATFDALSISLFNLDTPFSAMRVSFLWPKTTRIVCEWRIL